MSQFHNEDEKECNQCNENILIGLKYVLCTFGAIEDEIYDFDDHHKSF